MSEKFTYVPSGVCARSMTFEVEGNIIKNVQIVGGCPGNLLGISKILVGKTVEEVVEVFKGNRCGAKPTSCPDQIAKALIEHFNL